MHVVDWRLVLSPLTGPFGLTVVSVFRVVPALVLTAPGVLKGLSIHLSENRSDIGLEMHHSCVISKSNSIQQFRVDSLDLK